jgi:hypothetical protein
LTPEAVAKSRPVISIFLQVPKGTSSAGQGEPIVAPSHPDVTIE